jgi:hypothetical protein
MKSLLLSAVAFGFAPAQVPQEPAPADTTAPTSAAAPDDAGATGDSPTTPEPAAQAEPEVVEVINEPPPPRETVTYRVAQPQDGDPPYYSEEDMAKLRARHGLPGEMPEAERRARWRCLIADQTCGITFELNATSAYAMRLRQGDVTVTDEVARWNSGRAQYDAQLNIPVSSDTIGRFKYTRLTLAPKGGVIASDSRDLWGSAGIAGRYFFNRKVWSPTIEFSTALTFKLLGQGTCASGDETVACTASQRSPVGIHADIGFGLGGFGAIVVGGQYDSPLAREDLAEQFRVASSGMFYVGFRGNILWGGPLAAALSTHALATSRVEAP